MSGPLLHYVTEREGEEPVALTDLRVRHDRAGNPAGVQWRDPEPRDWDAQGVLWVRTSQNLDWQGRLWGKPQFARMHPARQREAMQDLRCSVCVGPPSRTAAGYLFLLEPEDAPLEGGLTIQPPLCLPHARYGTDHCSHLRAGWTLVRSRVPRLYGVLGGIARLRPDGSLDVEERPTGPNGRDLVIPYTARDITPWVIASQLLRRLTHVTEVRLEEELAAAGLLDGAPVLP
ncbi:MAG: hypothetical protein HOY69_37435 [Streptomyces sp.]|nr:hypothetical protein [Streptomyces sp.]